MPINKETETEPQRSLRWFLGGFLFLAHMFNYFHRHEEYLSHGVQQISC